MVCLSRFSTNPARLQLSRMLLVHFGRLREEDQVPLFLPNGYFSAL